MIDFQKNSIPCISINSYITKIFTFLVLASFAFSSTSCKAKKDLTETKVEEAPDGAQAFILAAAQNQFQADWLTGNAQLSYDDGNMTASATATIKMQKDKVIWMSVKKFGFEIGRAKITPDSVYLLDRFNNQYAIEPISYVEEKFGLPASLDMLQQIFLGNPVYLTTSNPKGDLQDDIYRLSAQSNDSRNDYWFSMPNYEMNKMELSQESKKRSVSILLQDYKDAGSNRDFSYLRQISVKSPETGQTEIKINFSKIEINVPTKINFSIPPRYTKMAY